MSVAGTADSEDRPLGVTLASIYLTIIGLLGLLIVIIASVMMNISYVSPVEELTVFEIGFVGSMIIGFGAIVLSHVVVGIGLLGDRGWAWVGTHAITLLVVMLGVLNVVGSVTVTIGTVGPLLVVGHLLVSGYLYTVRDRFKRATIDRPTQQLSEHTE